MHEHLPADPNLRPPTRLPGGASASLLIQTRDVIGAKRKSPSSPPSCASASRAVGGTLGVTAPLRSGPVLCSGEFISPSGFVRGGRYLRNQRPRTQLHRRRAGPSSPRREVVTTVLFQTGEDLSPWKNEGNIQRHLRSASRSPTVEAKTQYIKQNVGQDRRALPPGSARRAPQSPQSGPASLSSDEK